MSLPEFLSGSYRRYKEDTNIFITWLSQASKAAGFKPKKKPQQPTSESSKQNPQASSQRLKGKERKLAKEAAKANSLPDNAIQTVRYKVTTQDLLRQAEVVTKAGKDQMPSHVQRVLERAISARERCTQWFENVKARDHGNAGHRRFIEVLQSILSLLTRRDPEDNTVPGSSASDGQNTTIESVQNRFTILDIDDMDDEFTPTSTTVPTTSAKTASKPESSNQTLKMVEVYDIEVDELWDVDFKLFCFFEDLHAMEDAIVNLWKKYKDGRIDLVSATVATHAAIGMVSRTEKEILAEHPYLAEYGQSYTDLAMSVFDVEMLRNGRDPDEYLSSPESLEVTPLDEFLYLPTARILMKFSSRTMRDTIKKCAWPPPILQMRFSYIVRPELLEHPKYKKLEEEDRLLSQVLIDLLLIQEAKNVGEQHKSKMQSDFSFFSMFEDEFTKGVRSVWTGGGLSVYNVFASRILLDILDVCGKQALFHRQVLDTIENARRTFDFRVEDDTLDTGEVRWLTKDAGLVRNIYQLITHQFIAPAIWKESYLKHSSIQPPQTIDVYELPAEIRAELEARLGIGPDDGPSEEHKANAKRLNLQPILPAVETDFILKHNPLYCGHFALQLVVEIEEAGVALTNHHFSIFAAAHVYNALRQLNVIQHRWPEMERIIEVHAKPLFAGSIPTTPDTFFRRIAFRTGLTGPLKRFDVDKKWKIQTTLGSKVLKSLLEGKESIERSLLQIENQLAEYTEGAGQAAAKAMKRRRRQLTPLQFLSALTEYLPTILPTITIDYITLTKKCNRLMRRIRQRIGDELGVDHPSTTQHGDSNDHGYIFMVTAILRETEVEEELYRSREAFKGGVQLRVAGAELEAFLNASE